MSPTLLEFACQLQLAFNITKAYNNSMMWVACCLAFFGFLKVSEFTIPSDMQFDEEVHLCLDDISVDCRGNPLALRLRLKHSKTDPFRRGVSIYLGTTENNLCPVKGILPYLAMRGSCSGPLLIYTRLMVCQVVNIHP